MYKNPACTAFCLKTIYEIIQALTRGNLLESRQYTEAALAEIQNEIEWCFSTDSVLPQMKQFFGELNVTISTIHNDIPSKQKMQVQATIACLKQALTDIANTTNKQPEHAAVARYIDKLEIAFRTGDR